VTLIIASTAIFSQVINEEARKKDSIIIDSMQKLIPVKKDTARVNYLDKFCRKIIYSANTNRRKVEWATPFVMLAYNESKQLEYKIGMAKALMNFCQLNTYLHIANTRSKIDNSLVVKKFEKDVNELIKITEEINDPYMMGVAYDYQANYFGKIKKPDESLIAEKKALQFYKKAGEETKECETNLNISYTLLDKGEFENAFEYCTRSLELAKKLTAKSGPDDINEVWLQLSYINISGLYKAAGDYETALNMLLESRQFHFARKSSSTWGMESEIGNLYLESGQYDSAIHYLKPGIKNRKFSYEWPQVAKAYFKLNKIDSALKYYNLSIDSMEKRGKMPAVIDGLRYSYFGKSEILFQQKKYAGALDLCRKSQLMDKLRTDKLQLVNTYELMSQTFNKLGKNDSAYFYLLKHNELKNSLLSRQFLFRLGNYKKEAEAARKEATIGFLERDNKIKEQQLKQEASFKKFLLIGLLLLFVAGFFIIRTLLLKRKNDKLKSLQLENELKMQQLETEKRQTEFQKKTTELEMQALRAQMNPHFIFNCLSSINRFILKNEPDAASDYLTRFSRLIRMVLINSQKSLITLEDELDMLTIYLDMERLRFKNNFDYHIVFTNRLDAGAVYIPPLLLQPFCENAIWHGLKHLADPQSGRHELGRLDIELSMDNKALICRITDNGIGRQKAAEIRSKSAEEKKSLGLNITTERLALLNQEKELSTSYEIVDLKDEKGKAAGTSVKLKISLSETIKEPV
jgi:tetratricopeptide (TPR) repeat protein